MDNEFKPKGLFVNQEKAQCSIYESGRLQLNSTIRENRIQ